MRLVVTQNTTVDGAVEMIDGWFDPEAQDPELVALLQRHEAACDGVLLGRRTFEDFRGYWPEQTQDFTGASAFLDAVTKYVVTSTLTDPAWDNTTLLTGDPVAEVRRLKEQPGADLVLAGSITLAHTLLAAGLVDEVRQVTYPAVQGRGRRFFPDGWVVPRLERVDAAAFGGGVTYAAYVPAEQVAA